MKHEIAKHGEHDHRDVGYHSTQQRECDLVKAAFFAPKFGLSKSGVSMPSMLPIPWGFRFTTI